MEADWSPTARDLFTRPTQDAPRRAPLPHGASPMHDPSKACCSSPREGGWLPPATCDGCMALSLRSLQAMASIVRRFVRTESRTEQVAEPSSDMAMRLHPSLSRGDLPPSICATGVRVGRAKETISLHTFAFCVCTPGAKERHGCPFSQSWAIFGSGYIASGVIFDCA
jgi:hypothetical protein